MKTLTRNAYAKVNLALDVLRRREDGYHDVCMIMQNLSLYDTLTFTMEEADTLAITLSCDKEFVPCDERNLIYKAIVLMGETYHLTGHIHVELVKRIPVEAGMAGGSTDCAAAFHAMRELYGLDVSDQELMKLGVKLGADVPYCIMAKTALSEGIGEVLTEVAPLPDCYVVVAKPTISVSTKMVYENLHANELQHHPDVAGMIEALKQGDLSGVASRMENVLETVTTKLYPQIEEIKQSMKESGAENAIMSGSGPTVFGLYREKAIAEQAAEKIRQQYGLFEVYVTQPC
ncbi:4-(cytidine 5'-diphospho)-2-C-methyl-D-erythritol kinase [Eubacterium sp. MSJ-21]|nr:4-(cytidine 5'-diphospho)-2-C-methyl-D-erythritol kinase [Eubacterium sp. MSJ-21]